LFKSEWMTYRNFRLYCPVECVNVQSHVSLNVLDVLKGITRRTPYLTEDLVLQELKIVAQEFCMKMLQLGNLS
jgi:hypothetical protein